jgi:hypothetical protein
MIQYFRNCLKGSGSFVAGSTNKKILLRRFERESLAGFVNPQSYLQADGIEVLTSAGSLLLVPYPEVKAVHFVRDFDGGEPSAESRLFQNRPKMNGIWIRMRFRDGELADGLIPNNLLQIEPQGFTFIPPNAGANNQKVFVPRAALADVQVVGVVGSPLRLHKAKPEPERQPGLFD